MAIAGGPEMVATVAIISMGREGDLVHMVTFNSPGQSGHSQPYLTIELKP